MPTIYEKLYKPVQKRSETQTGTGYVYRSIAEVLGRKSTVDVDKDISSQLSQDSNISSVPLDKAQ